VISGGVEWIVDRDEAVDKRGGMSLSGCITCTAGGRLGRRDDVAECKGGGWTRGTGVGVESASNPAVNGVDTGAVIRVAVVGVFEGRRSGMTAEGGGGWMTSLDDIANGREIPVIEATDPPAIGVDTAVGVGGCTTRSEDTQRGG
jgi:hypothetical protein